jgi:hypothetical protein
MGQSEIDAGLHPKDSRVEFCTELCTRQGLRPPA